MDHIESTAELREVVEVIAWVILPEEKKGEEPWLHWLRSVQAKARAAITASMPVGNAAAMREALQSCLDTICRIVWIDDPEYDEDGHYLGANYAAVSRDKARAALAAPARNCDRFCSIEQARAAYRAEVRNVLIWDGYESERFAKWLLALAAERKGDNDEQK